MPKVTVLMPMHNAERYLREAIDSVLAQTYTDFEFLIIDDASTDSSCDIVQSYNDNRICLLRSDNRLRFSRALNKGLDVAKGEYIARMDADDICHPKRFSVQVHFLDQHPSIGICGTWAKTFGAGVRHILRKPCGYNNIRATTLFETPFAHPTVMMRKQKFNEFNLRYNDDFYPTEDFELWSRAVKCFPCENIDKVLLYYRIHEQSMTGSEWTDMDSKARVVVERELRDLLHNVNEDTVCFHRNIGRGLSYQCRTWSELERAEKWFLGLIEANSSVQKYETGALLRVIGAAWYRVCFNSAPLGVWVLFKYWNSMLRKTSLPGERNYLFLCLSVIKHKFISVAVNYSK